MPVYPIYPAFPNLRKTTVTTATTITVPVGETWIITDLRILNAARIRFVVNGNTVERAACSPNYNTISTWYLPPYNTQYRGSDFGSPIVLHSGDQIVSLTPPFGGTLGFQFFYNILETDLAIDGNLIPKSRALISSYQTPGYPSGGAHPFTLQTNIPAGETWFIQSCVLRWDGNTSGVSRLLTGNLHLNINSNLYLQTNFIVGSNLGINNYYAYEAINKTRILKGDNGDYISFNGSINDGGSGTSWLTGVQMSVLYLIYEQDIV